jgi:hypothetical protein
LLIVPIGVAFPACLVADRRIAARLRAELVPTSP